MPKRISIIIPTYNSSAGIKATLNSFRSQIIVDDIQLEVIVVDNNSNDSTSIVVRDFEHDFYSFLYINEPKQGSYAARNLGIKHSTGDLICFIDADVEVGKSFISKVVMYFDSTDVEYAGVNVRMKKTSNSLAANYDLLTSFDVKKNLERGKYSPTLCLIIRAKILKEIGPFDDRLESGGDVVFGQYAFKSGVNQAFIEDIEVSHPTRNTLSAILKKARRVGRGYATHMIYYPNHFDHEKRFFSRIKFYLPRNPISLYKRSKILGENVTFLKCVLVSLINPLVSLTYLFSYKKYMRLHNESQ